MEIADLTLAFLHGLHASPSILAVGFSVLLVLSLVTVEEIEVRRAAAAPGDEPRRP